jgi:hypothetical protein
MPIDFMQIGQLYIAVWKEDTHQITGVVHSGVGFLTKSARTALFFALASPKYCNRIFLCCFGNRDPRGNLMSVRRRDTHPLRVCPTKWVRRPAGPKRRKRTPTGGPCASRGSFRAGVRQSRFAGLALLTVLAPLAFLAVLIDGIFQATLDAHSLSALLSLWPLDVWTDSQQNAGYV